MFEGASPLLPSDLKACEFHLRRVPTGREFGRAAIIVVGRPRVSKLLIGPGTLEIGPLGVRHSKIQRARELVHGVLESPQRNQCCAAHDACFRQVGLELDSGVEVGEGVVVLTAPEINDGSVYERRRPIARCEKVFGQRQVAPVQSASVTSVAICGSIAVSRGAPADHRDGGAGGIGGKQDGGGDGCASNQ